MSNAFALWQGVHAIELSSDGQTLAVCTMDELLLYSTFELLGCRKTRGAVPAAASLVIPHEASVVHLKWGPAHTPSANTFLVVTSDGELLMGQLCPGDHPTP